MLLQESKIFNELISRIYSLDTSKRRSILIILDFILLLLAFIVTFLISPFSLGEYSNPNKYGLIFCFVGIISFYFFGQYRGLTKYVGSKSIYKLAITNIFIILCSSIIIKISYSNVLGFKFLFLYWIFSNIFINLKKLLLRDILIFLNKNDKKLENVIIYGAGSAGAQLSNNLIKSGGYFIQSFIDENKLLWGRNINGIQIYPPKFLKTIDLSNSQIFIAIPSLNHNKKLKIISYLKKFNIPIKEIPSLEDLTSGRAKIDELQPIKLEDILGRKNKSNEIKLSPNKLKNKVILVTGAGGSIGQEICKQILKVNPKKLILFDVSEASLFQIYSKLGENNLNNQILIPLLGNATNKTLVKNVIDKYNVKIIFHAAAYKHVPLVELNPLEGLYNNVFSTKVICECASEADLENVVLISSDKAVRPCNIMGCSKRLSELIVQAYSNLDQKTIFSMVRFGNVLFSSGSVVPLFINQIKNGGPITLTHFEISRYFMSIQEAVQLVLKTIDLSEGGDIFLLDMGNPIKIIDLARQMIKLSGLKEKTSAKDKEGDIEIIETGLRPGEKLYEELLIDSKSIPTSHPQIYKGIEKSIQFKELNERLNSLEELLDLNKKEQVFKLVSNLVPEWKRSEINKIK